MTTLPINSIRMGDRIRRDMGDLKSLADSIARHGLLHPIVVMKDGTLVAGARRIEAARLLGWDEVAGTVVDVDDLLSAERDENQERKDFTPTEAVAIGRLIEEKHKAKIAAVASAVVAKASRLGVAARQGTASVKDAPGQSLALGKADVVAGKAVGLSESTYFRAKQIVNAAEEDPERFGDLPAKMDATKVAAVHRELLARGGGRKAKTPTTNGRSAVHHGAHHPKANEEMQRAVLSLEGLCLGLKDIDLTAIDPAKAHAWSDSLKKSVTVIRRLQVRLANVKAA